ncbi:hypothetical protein M1B35_22055 [Pseudomonas sp. MAFF 302046]|uniref:Uncharacterized protein n=1 Tax=Pseudomonas morbosilactucae TaxID=2938197 RepID=A0ABT0JM59_9PSED|nr:hypothetical protein [Pseudomonas morbosilactucae]MCK9816735.1 hypothetical protein [Pseudomonas morbosilactucae]
MNKKNILGLVLGLGMLGAASSASASDNLFKSYAYESPISAYTKAKGYFDCSEDVGGTALCLEDVDFLEHKFTAALIFSNSKLIMVSLLSPFDQNLYATSIGSISKTFTLSALADGKSQLDLIQLAGKSSSREEFTSQFANYESAALTTGEIVYTFFEGVDKSKKYSSIVGLLQGSPDNIRAAEVVLTGQGAESSLIIRFSLPKLEANKVSAAAKKPVESF